ncbi:TonB-dependent receptor [Phenylobacterium sp.]|uniref:TonB-dependent receptor n=1 Tax=Phenylobacterium sp. TaxID=1871053 RepID=UPI003D2B0994
MFQVLSRRACLIAGASAVVLSATPAFAQTAAGAEDNTVDVLIVTAQRREESANTVAMGIQAVRGETLERLHVTDAKDLSAFAPSFTVSQSYQGVPTYTLRGIGFNTINLSATSTVGTYTDEVAYAYPFMNTGPIFDLERVEVLKGPQGTLYGRNTTAGLIDFVTNKPTDEFAAQVTAEVGNYKTVNLDGFINGKLAEGVSGRLAFKMENSDKGWQISNTRGERQGQVDRWGVRGSLKLEPTDKLAVDLSLSAWNNQSDTVAAQGIGFTPATSPGTNTGNFNAPGLVTYIANNQPTKASQADWAPRAGRSADVGIGQGLDGPLREDNDFRAVKLRVTYELTDDMRIVSLTSFNDLKRRALFDWSGAPNEILLQRARGDIESAAEELRIEGETEKSNWLIGAYMARDEIYDANRTLLGQNANVGLIRFVGSTLLASPFNTGGFTAAQMAQAFRTYEDFGDIDTRIWSVFANADYRITEALKVTAGIRYTEDRQTYAGCSNDHEGSMLPNVNTVNRTLFFAAYGLVSPIQRGGCVTFNPATRSFGLVSSRLDENNVAWRLALDWKPAQDVLVFGSISRGAKAGATPINAANISTQNAPARQELLTAYELGVKAGLLERRLQANISAFYYDYKDKQLSVYFADPIYTALSRLQNVPDSEAYGVDGEITWRITPQLTAVASGTLLHTEVQGYVGINSAGRPQDFDGKPFLYSPKRSGALTLLYGRELTEDLGLQAALNARWQDDSHADLEGDPKFTIKDYGLVNASLGVHSLDDKWRAQLWVRNLTNTYYWTAVSSNANVVVRFPGQPRTFGASLTFAF